MWHDYFSFVGSNTQEITTSGLSSDDRDLPLSKTIEGSSIKYPMSYLHDLRSCIIHIISGIFLLEHGLLSAFCTEFQENCLALFQLATTGTAAESVERVIQFVVSLGQHATQKGEAWPLVYLVGPMLAKSFPLIRSLVSSYILEIICSSSLIFPSSVPLNASIAYNLVMAHRHFAKLKL